MRKEDGRITYFPACILNSLAVTLTLPGHFHQELRISS